MFLEAIQGPPPFGLGLLTRFVDLLDASGSSIPKILRPSAHDGLRRFRALVAFFFFVGGDRAVEAA
jgi:hypothetical protein